MELITVLRALASVSTGQDRRGLRIRSWNESVFVSVIRWFNLLACGGPAMVCLCAGHLSSGHLVGLQWQKMEQLWQPRSIKPTSFLPKQILIITLSKYVFRKVTEFPS